MTDSKQKAKKRRGALAYVRNKLKFVHSAAANFDGDSESMQVEWNTVLDTTITLDANAKHETDGAHTRTHWNGFKMGNRLQNTSMGW